MTFLSDLDVSVIDESPPGRQEVETLLLIDNRRRDDILAIIEKSVTRASRRQPGRESEALQLQTAEETFEQQASLKGCIADSRPLEEWEKIKIMAAEAHEIDLLVATTVIGGGGWCTQCQYYGDWTCWAVSVLAQLHQLRGRVGVAGQSHLPLALSATFICPS